MSFPSPYGPGGDQTNQAHRNRLEMMQQERIVDPNKRLKRYHWRAVMTPMMMKYWVPLFAVFGCAAMLSGRVNEEARNKRGDEMRRKYGHKMGPDGVPNNVREMYIREHLDRVIKGEDPFEVADELQHRYKMEQRKLKRELPENTNPTMTMNNKINPMTMNNNNSPRVPNSSLQR